MKQPTFKSLHTGAAFTFPGTRGNLVSPQGPWVKVGPSTYRELQDGYAHGPTHRVGTVAVKVELAS